ncbi:MAG: hypothetical protein ACTSSP_00460 [Candidatus Asgardarchaeia archaeon]
MARNGVKIIDRAVGRFKGIVKDLDNGINACGKEQTKNTAKVDKLTAKNEVLQTKTKQAVIFRDNLNSMLHDEKPPSGEEKAEEPENAEDQEN